MRQRIRRGQGGGRALAGPRLSRRADAEAERLRGAGADRAVGAGGLHDGVRPVRAARVRGARRGLPAQAVQRGAVRGSAVAGAGAARRAGAGRRHRRAGRRRAVAAGDGRTGADPRRFAGARAAGGEDRLRRGAGRLRLLQGGRQAVPQGSDDGRARGAARSGALRAHSPLVLPQHRSHCEGRALRQGQPGGDPARRHAAAGEPGGVRGGCRSCCKFPVASFQPVPVPEPATPRTRRPTIDKLLAV